MTVTDLSEALGKAHRALSEASALLSGQVYEYLSREKITPKTVPSGYAGTRKSKKQGIFSRGHRVVQYNQPLSQRLKDKFKLIPLSPDDPSVQQDAQWALASTVRTTIIDEGLFELDMGGGKFLNIDMNDDGMWEISIRNLSGRPLGRPRAFRSLEKVLPNLWEYLSDAQKAPFIRRVLPVF